MTFIIQAVKILLFAVSVVVGSGTSEAFLHVLTDPDGDRAVWEQKDDFWVLWTGTKMNMLGHVSFKMQRAW